MRFKDHFLNRLQSLNERETGVFPEGTLPDSYSKAAVLLPFWENANGGVDIVMTMRPETMSSHAGQVSFPGGRFDTADPSLEHTAIRETKEELGIDPGLVKVMGRLDDAWSITGHYVVPYVAWLQQEPTMTANKHEVAEVLVADVETLLAPMVNTEHRVEYEGRIYHTHAFDWEGGYVWGLTADILLELLLWVKGEPSNRAHLRLDSIKLRLKGDT